MSPLRLNPDRFRDHRTGNRDLLEEAAHAWPSAERRQADGEEQDDAWVLTYSDLMALLLVFFIVLVSHLVSRQAAFSVETLTVRETREPAPIATPLPQPAIPGPLPAVFTEETPIGADPEGMVIMLEERVTFALGEADLLESALPILQEVARFVREQPLSLIEVVGHTDDRPIRTPRFPSNWELSLARANAVVRYLIEREGMDPRRLSAKGVGEYHPRVPNDTEEQRALNRRVEVRLRYPVIDREPGP